MSTATPNFFSVLGEESGPAVGTGAVHLEQPPKTVQKQSSKKSDANPKADPAKARKRSPGAPSNDRVLRENKDAGRENNRRAPVKTGANQHYSRRGERTDRQPRSLKKDTPKRTRSGWGGEEQEPKEEAAGEQIAHEEEAADAAEDAEFDAAQKSTELTLEQYQQQQREIADSLKTRAKKSSSGSSPAVAAAEPRTSSAPEPRKKPSTKPRKEVRTLEIEEPTTSRKPASSSPYADQRPNRGERGERGGDRRSNRSSGRKSSPGSAKASSKPAKNAFDVTSLPKLN